MRIYLDVAATPLAGVGTTDANGEFKTAFLPGSNYYLVEAHNSGNTASSTPKRIRITSGIGWIPILLISNGDGGTIPGNSSTLWYDSNPSAANFRIANADQLIGLAYLVNNGNNFRGKTVFIDTDIDLAGKEWTPIGTRQNPFQGTFDGNDQTIWNMTITGGASDAGLFGAVGSDGFITSLNVASVNINVSSVSGSNAGSIAGYSEGEINACAFDGSISASGNAGGIAGETDGGFIASCSTFDRHIDSVSVSAANAGGIIGMGKGTEISGCRVNGAVLASQYAGGVAGNLFGGEIEGCTLSGYVYAESHADDASISAGGVAGLVSGGIVRNSRSSAAISAYVFQGTVMAGGIVGFMDGIGEVSGCEKNSGFVIGRNSSGTLSSGLIYKGGIIAFNYNSRTVVSDNEFSRDGTLVEYGIGYDSGPPSNRGCRVNL
jgi:hypothetical protein